MRSESEVRWIRVKNVVGQATKASQWHAIIPGWGDLDLWPGTSCSTALVGTPQFAQNSAMKNMDGPVHDECRQNVRAYIQGIDPSPGPGTPPDSEPELAAPDTTYTEMPSRKP